MKLIKYILFIIILITSVVFIKELDSINILADGTPIKIKIPYIKNNFPKYIIDKELDSPIINAI